MFVLCFHISANHVDKDILESQWRKLVTLSIHDVFPGRNVVDITLQECWVQISKQRTASGEKMFSELSDFAFRILTLPISNAVVERVFSVTFFGL